MKKAYSLFLVAVLLGFSSCSIIDSLIPDVNTEYSITFPVEIGDNSGSTEPDSVDVTDSEDYNDFKDNIDGYEIQKILFQIRNFNAPADMFFEGQLLATSIDGTENATVGTIERFRLSEYADDIVEHQVTKVATGVKKVVSWLDSPGKFLAEMSYQLTDESGQPYEIPEESNYFFDVKIIYKVKVKTGT